MIDVTIYVGTDGPYYPTKVESLPSVGDYIDLTSYTDMKHKQEHYIELKVVKVIHELVEFNEKDTNIIKKHHHNVNLICKKIK